MLSCADNATQALLLAPPRVRTPDGSLCVTYVSGSPTPLSLEPCIDGQLSQQVLPLSLLASSSSILPFSFSLFCSLPIRTFCGHVGAHVLQAKGWERSSGASTLDVEFHDVISCNPCHASACSGRSMPPAARSRATPAPAASLGIASPPPALWGLEAQYLHGRARRLGGTPCLPQALPSATRSA